MKETVEAFIKRVYGEVDNLRITENGHGGRADVVCNCGSKAKLSCCLDVKGIWINCPSCGFFDI